MIAPSELSVAIADEIQKGIPKYRYIPVCWGVDKMGMITEASQLIKMDMGDNINYEAVFVTGFAFCSPKDNFAKATGRSFALPRLEHNLKHCCIMPVTYDEMNFLTLGEFALLSIYYQAESLPQALHELVADYAEGTCFVEAMASRIVQCSQSQLEKICPNMI